MERFLIIDEATLAEQLSHFFGDQGFHVDVANKRNSVIRCLESYIFDVVIIDVDELDSPPEDYVRLVKESNGYAVTIAVCSQENLDTAIRAVRKGATDFLLKPVNLSELELRIEKGLDVNRLLREGQALRGERPLIYRTKNFIGRSKAILDVLDLVEKVAKSSTSVVLLGETGTGKELLAGAIHYNSPRAENPFIRVNCATLPDTLLESELFGHERGAFTGAEKLRIGRFEQGNKGSVFLDEVADVTLPTQAKLLRVLQEHEFERLGSNRTVKVDVRVISATNKDLEDEIAGGRFREDLYYRLNVVTIKVPPLRNRTEDIEPLAEFFMHKFSHSLDKKIRMIDPGAMRLLKDYHWPGNVRELENTLERAVLLAETDVITRRDLGLPGNSHTNGEEDTVRIPPGGLKWEEMEKNLILQALEKSNWVQKEAAALLGLTARVLNYRIKQFGITHPSWKQNK